MRSIKNVKVLLSISFAIIIWLLLPVNGDTVDAAAARAYTDDMLELSATRVNAESLINSSTTNIIKQKSLNSSITTGDYYDLLDSTGKLFYMALATAYADPGTYSNKKGGSYGTASGLSSIASSSSTFSYYLNICAYAYAYDHIDQIDPLLCSYIYGSSGDDLIIYAFYASSSYTQSSVAALESQLTSARLSFVSSLDTSGLSDYEIELLVHDAIVEKVTYDTAAASSGTVDVAHTAYGALVDSSAVCDGYSSAFMYVLDYYGIDARVVTGTANGGGHAWSMVQLDSSWYEVDTTWDDAYEDYGYIWYKYFNITTSDISSDHTRDNLGNLLPTATGTTYAYDGSSLLKEISSTSSSTDSTDSTSDSDTTSSTDSTSDSDTTSSTDSTSDSDTTSSTDSTSDSDTASSSDGSSNTDNRKITDSASSENTSSSDTDDDSTYSTGYKWTDSKGFKYKIKSDGEVALVRLPSDIDKNKTKYKTLTLPNTATLDGNTYKVTSISFENGSAKLKYTKTLIIPANIKSIAKNSFKNAKTLKTVTIKGKLTSVGKYAFKNVSNSTVFKLKKSYFKNNKKLLQKAKTNSKVKYKKF